MYVTASGDDSVSVVTTADTRIPCRGEPNAVVVAPDGGRAYVGNRTAKTVSVVDLRTNTVVEEVSLSRQISGMSMTPDGELLCVAGDDGFAVLSLSSPVSEVLSAGGVVDGAQDVAVTPDGSHLFIAQAGTAHVAVFDLAAFTDSRPSRRVSMRRHSR